MMKLVKNNPVILTSAALSAMRSMLKDRVQYNAVRLKVKSSGCSGCAYHMEYATESCEKDEVMYQDDMMFLIDRSAMLYVVGSVIDYHDSGLEAGFVFKNPNEGGKCGCGESFSIKNYFELFKLPINYNISLEKLENIYLELQVTYHPDKAENKELAAGATSMINAAFAVLKDPLKRAEYMLSLNGVSVGVADSVSDDFLTRSMEINMQIESSKNTKEVKIILQKIQDDIDHSITNLVTAFEDNNFSMAKKYITLLRYNLRLLSTASDKLHVMEHNS